MPTGPSVEAGRSVGRVLDDRYQLIAPIGQGASAAVFLADDTRLGRRVAVKLAHPVFAGDDRFQRRFQAEARAAAQLSHPHLLAVFDWGNDPDAYLVTELLAGGSLRSILEQGGRLSPSQALVVGLHAARGLDHAHRRGFVHRDIKPANLLFGSDDRLRVADFGIARAVAEAAWTEPEGALIGTARYAAPEQATGQSLDGRADVYALALTMIEAITGEVPLVENSPLATMLTRQDTDLPVSDELGPLAPILREAGRADPDQRPDAGEFARQLLAAASELPPPRRLPLVELDTEGLVSAAAQANANAPTGSVGSGGAVLDVEGDPEIDLTGASPGTSFSQFDFGDDTDFGNDNPSSVSAKHTAFQPEVASINAETAGSLADDDDYDYEPVESRGRIFAVLVLLFLAAALVTAIALRPKVIAEPEPEVVLPTVGSYVGEPLEDVRVDARVNNWELEVVERRVDGSEAGAIIEQNPRAGTELAEGETLQIVVSTGAILRPVPDLVGLTRLVAVERITNAGLTLGTVDSTVFDEEAAVGEVLESTPAFGDEVETGTLVNLVVSAGPEPRIVPDVTALSVPEAEAALLELGLLMAISEEHSQDVAEGSIVAMATVPGTTVERGDTVEIIVSLGLPFVIVPDTNGMRGAEADDVLTAAGFVVVDTVGPPNGVVLATDPPAGESHRQGTEVRIITRRQNNNNDSDDD